MKRLVLATLFFCVAVFAQRDLATIVGSVTDPQGGTIPNAKVTLTETATAVRYELQTNDSGEYIRPALKPGTYSIEVEATGFKKSIQTGVILTAGDRTAVNLQLQVGDVGQSIEVSADAPVLQTESTVLGHDISSKSVSELPVGGQRIFTFLARVTPGVVPAEGGARDEAGGGFSANGVRSNGQNNFLLNGVDNNVNVIDFLNQTSYVVGPALDAIGEMRILTNGYGAEYGRGAGGVVDVTLKSGTNQLHASVWEYLQNNALDANRWENNRNGTPIGPFRQNQYGVAAGGPILKNKLFIFGDYQGTRISSTGGAYANLGTSSYFTIPTAAMKNGDFSSLLGAAVAGTNVPSGTIFDPETGGTRTPFPGNKIPANRFDPAALKIMNLFPATNAPIVTGGIPANDYFTTTSGTWDTDQGDTRVDYHLSDKDTIFGSLSWSDTNKFNGQPLPGALDATYFNSNAEVDLSRNAMISHTHVWTPAILSETRIAFTRLVTSRVQADPNTDQFKAFGIGGYDPTTTLNGGLPSVNMGRYSGFGASDWLPSKEYNNVWDFIENVAINKGTHALKFGAEFRPIKFPFFQVPSPHGDLTFAQNSTSIASATGGANNLTGDEYASFLLGTIYQGQISTNNFISSQKTAWAFYGQDDWKVNSKLTVNIGLRYELFSPIDERFGRQSNFDLNNLTLYIPKGKDSNAPLPPNFATAFPQVTVSRGKVPSTLIPWDKFDFGPRLGAAYQYNSKTVIRVGYGIFYGGEENQGGYPNRGEAVPFNETVNLDRGTAGIFDPSPYFTTLSAGFPSNVFALPAPVSFRGVEQNFRNPLVHKWNVAVQRDLGNNLSLELSYVGNHQAHQVDNPDPNAPYNSPIPGLNNNTLRPYPNIGGIADTASFGFGNYDGLETKIEKRYSNGLQFLGSWTWGHAFSTTGTTLTGSSNFGAINAHDESQAYSSAAWDIRHSVVISGTYELPFGKGKKYLSGMNKAEDLILGGWQANTIATFRTGPPISLGTTSCVGEWNHCGPDVVAGKDPKNAPSGGRNPAEWFDTSAVTFPHVLANGYGTPGNLGLQAVNRPGQRSVDLSLFKGFAITERFNIQFRAEAFNLANTPQWGEPNSQQGNPAFGQITSTQSGTERHVQFALRLAF
jgi:hypothetical protein